jgi:hypothetical protein
MSINYYLFCKKSYDKIIYDLENIISIFEELDEFAKEENVIVLQTQPHNKTFFNERKKHITILRSVCEKKISELCSHEFIEDTIDIDLDRSQNIRYCKICEYTDTN